MVQIESRRARGLPVPVPIQPRVEPWNQELWQAFWLINRGRSYAASSGYPMPLSLHDIKTYLEIYAIDGIDSFVQLILALDSIYLDYHHKKLDKEQKKESGSKDVRRTHKNHR